MFSQSLLEHIEALRKVILKILIALVIVFPVCYYFNSWFLEQLINFANSHVSNVKMYYFSPMEAFFVKIKISFYISLLVSYPYNIWQIWKFIVPALYEHERRRIILWIFGGSLLFFLGVIFSLFVIFPIVIQFSYSFSSEILKPMLSLGSVISLISLLMFGFGIMFQFPLAIVLLVQAGLVKNSFFKQNRALVFVIILIASAFLTPPDIISQVLLAVPTYILFEIGIFLAERR